MTGAIKIPRVSVLMAVFNTASYLREALESIRRQTFSDFELIVVDDGSTDGSTEVLQAFAATEPRMKLVARSNRGLIATRNELLNAGGADLLAWMDSDDVSLPDRLARQVAILDTNSELVCVGCAAQCIDPDGNYLKVESWPLTHQQILEAHQTGGAMRFPTTVMRRGPAQLIGGFREPFKIGEDFDFLLRLSEQGRMMNLPDALYLYRQHISSVCAMLGPNWLSYRDKILELASERAGGKKDRLQLGSTLEIPVTAPRNRRQVEGQVYMSWALQAFGNSNYPVARKYAVQGLMRWPLLSSSWKTLLRVLLRSAMAKFSAKRA